MIKYTTTMYWAKVCLIPFSKLSICYSFSPFFFSYSIYMQCDHLFIFCFMECDFQNDYQYDLPFLYDSLELQHMGFVSSRLVVLRVVVPMEVVLRAEPAIHKN